MVSCIKGNYVHEKILYALGDAILRNLQLFSIAIKKSFIFDYAEVQHVKSHVFRQLITKFRETSLTYYAVQFWGQVSNVRNFWGWRIMKLCKFFCFFFCKIENLNLCEMYLENPCSKSLPSYIIWAFHSSTKIDTWLLHRCNLWVSCHHWLIC